MLTIERNFLFWKMKNSYFMQENQGQAQHVHIHSFLHSFVAKENFRAFDTLQFDLTKGHEVLLMEMNKSTRRQIRRATEEPLEFIHLDKPTNQDLLEFQKFYNQFAKNKGTYTCNRFHMNTMKLLRDQDALVLTNMKNQQGELLCARIYIVDQEFVMNLYSASHYRMSESPAFKRLLGQANRYLIWRSMIYFQEQGIQVYDMGGLTESANIRRFKLGFGGEIVPVYSGYEGVSFAGHLIVKMRNWKIAFAKKRDIQ